MTEPQTTRPRAVEESAQWFRTLADNTSTAIFVYRQTFLYVNQAAAELTGYDEEQLLAMPFWDVVHPDHQDLVRRRGEARQRGEQVPRRYEFKIVRRDGAVRWVDFTAGSIAFGGAPAGLGTAFDVTERRLAEEALRESEERLKLASRAADIVTWDWDIPSDRLVTADYAHELFDLTAEELGATADDFMRLVHPDDREPFRTAVREALAASGVLATEIRLVTPGGVRWLHERAKVVRGADGRAARMLGAARDITRRKLAEIALRASEEKYRLLVEAQTDMVAKLDERGRLTFVSPSFCAFFGARDDDLLGREAPFLAGPDEPGAAMPSPRELVAELLRRGGSLRSERRVAVRGGWRWVSWAISALGGEEGGAREILAVGRDSTERKLAEEALFEEKERAQVTLASIGDGVIRTDAHGRIDYLNTVAEKLTGWSLGEAYGRPLGQVFQVVDPATGLPLVSPVDRALREQRRIVEAGERLLLRGDGRRSPIRDTAAPIRDQQGGLRGAVLVFQDLTAQREIEREMSHLATHDTLTGLINRREFERRLEEALAQARAGGQPAALCYVDLDDFKLVNDTCGHVAGDELLKQLATLLGTRIRGGDQLARLGGDEFGILLAGAGPDAASRRAADISQLFQGFRFTWEGRIFEIGASIGLVPLDAASGDLASVLSAADAACYVAKEGGRNRVHEYQLDDTLMAERYGEMQWIHRIHQAFEEDRFRLWAQPIQRTFAAGAAPLAEVFIRMLDENGESVSAAAFIRPAERYRLIGAIDRWVVRRAFAELAAGGASGQAFAINLSGQSLADESFLAEVVAELETSGASPGRICFEITETAAIANLPRALRFISLLRGLGCRFILDDFGSGLSSFAYLKNLQVDFLKIDGEFVRNMHEDGVQQALVEAIHQVGKALGLRTIAESVESEATLARLREIGVDYVQGYFLGKPAPLP